MTVLAKKEHVWLKSEEKSSVWLDKEMYPFQSRSWDSGEGLMHYVDEGQGEPVVMVHGTPMWSFLYRHQIRELSKNYRCLASDHLGFGLSDKPKDGAYHVADHALRLEKWLESLEVGPVHLVVHDFGGPIGLSYALKHPERIKSLTILNTWMWSVADNPDIQKIARMIQGWFGRFLYLYLNASPRFLVKSVFADKSKLTKEIHAHYTKPFTNRTERIAHWTLGTLLAEPWFDSLWEQRERIRHLPTQFIWSMKDPTFTPVYLERWEGVFDNYEIHQLPEAGHFSQEEAPEEVNALLQRFLASQG